MALFGVEGEKLHSICVFEKKQKQKKKYSQKSVDSTQ